MPAAEAVKKPEIGLTWRRRLDLSPSPYVRFSRCEVVHNRDGKIGRGSVYICWRGSPPKFYPAWPDSEPMAMDRKRFLEEYEPDPDQTELF